MFLDSLVRGGLPASPDRLARCETPRLYTYIYNIYLYIFHRYTIGTQLIAIAVSMYKLYHGVQVAEKIGNNACKRFVDVGLRIASRAPGPLSIVRRER